MADKKVDAVRSNVGTTKFYFFIPKLEKVNTRMLHQFRYSYYNYERLHVDAAQSEVSKKKTITGLNEIFCLLFTD